MVALLAAPPSETVILIGDHQVVNASARAVLLPAHGTLAATGTTSGGS